MSNSGTKAGERMCREWPWLTDEQRNKIVVRSGQLMFEPIHIAVGELSAMAVRFAVENLLKEKQP